MTHPGTSIPGIGPVGDDDLQAFLDRRLPPERLAVVEAYLASHPDIAARLSRTTELEARLSGALRDKFEEPIPARLRVATLTAHRDRRRYALLRRAAAIVLIVGASGAGGWFSHDFAARPDRLTAASANADAAFRTFSVEVRHPVEVRATEALHLTQWISARLQRPLTPPDLGALGFHLMGGRVLPTAGAPAALLMYDNDLGTRLTVYVQPMPIDSEEFHYLSRDDVRTVFWARDRLALAVTGRATQPDLLAVAQAVRRAMDQPEATSNP